ncbi:MAG: hypothetical protein ACE5H0_12570 [Bacteroidota bacterium]
MKADNNFKVRGMRFNEGQEATPYEPDRSLATIDTSQGWRFLYDGNPFDGIIRSGFKQPQDLTYSSDSRYIFAVDSGTNSLYQFISSGVEGIRPPAFSQEQKNIIMSYGRKGGGNNQFRDPFGVAYYDPIRLFWSRTRGTTASFASDPRRISSRLQWEVSFRKPLVIKSSPRLRWSATIGRTSVNYALLPCSRSIRQEGLTVCKAGISLPHNGSG